MRRRKTNLLLLAGWADRCGRLVTPHLGLSRREDAAHGPFSLSFSFFCLFAGKSWRATNTAFIYSVCAASGIKYAPCTQHSRLDSILRCAPASQLRLPCLLVSSQAGSSGTRAVFPLTTFPSPAGDAASERDRERREKGLTAAPPMLHACLDPNPACALQAETKEKKALSLHTPKSHQGRNSARKPKAMPIVGKRRSGESASAAHFAAVSPCGAARQKRPSAPSAQGSFSRAPRLELPGFCPSRGIVMLAYSSNIIKLRICSFCMTREPWAVTKLS